MQSNTLTDGATTLTCRNEIGKTITLPVAFLYRSLQDGRKLQRVDGQPLTIAQAGEQELVCLSTNYSSGHQLTVGVSATLAAWDGVKFGRNGRMIRAGDANGKDLAGEYGHYAVKSASKKTGVAYRVNCEIVGGIYVESAN